MPGQPGNSNAMKNGRRSSRPGTVLMRLGPRFKQAYSDIIQFRKQVERALGRAHCELSLLQSARVQTLCRLELNCRIAEQTIRDTQAMQPEELRATRALIAQWTAQRDNALVKLLGNGAVDPSADPWALYDSLGSPQATNGVQDEPVPSRAAIVR